MHAEFCIFTYNAVLVTSSELPVFTFHFVSDSVCYGSRTELQQRWFFSEMLSACWTGLGWAGHWFDLFFSWTASPVFFCLNSVGFKCCMRMAGHLLYFRIQFSVNHIICLHTFFLATQSLEVEGETRCDTISMLTSFIDFFQITVKNINSENFCRFDFLDS